MTPESPDRSYSQPLVNRSGKCDSTKNGDYPCVGKWQDASYTNNTVIDTADASNTKYDYGPGSYKIGTYYNYCAASAGTYCYAAMIIRVPHRQIVILLQTSVHLVGICQVIMVAIMVITLLSVPLLRVVPAQATPGTLWQQRILLVCNISCLRRSLGPI